MSESSYRSRFVNDLREKLGCEQKTFAGIVGVTMATVSRWENNQATPRNPRWEMLHDLNEELNRSNHPKDLLDLLKVASTVFKEPPPLELLSQGRLRVELRERIRAMDLFDGDSRTDLL